MHVCYFSKKCRFCQAFFEELSKTPYAREIRFVCVDPSPSRPPLPAWLKSVPTLIVQGESGPRIGPSAVNNWLAERRMMDGGSKGGVPTYSTSAATVPAMSAKLPDPISANTPADSKQGPPVLDGSHMEGPQAWHGEMDGSNWSDGYSFLNDNFTSERGYNPIVRNFESLVSAPSMGGMGGNGGNGGMGSAPAAAAQRSAKEEKLLKDFEAYSKSRDMEFSAPQRKG